MRYEGVLSLLQVPQLQTAFREEMPAALEGRLAQDEVGLLEFPHAVVNSREDVVLGGR